MISIANTPTTKELTKKPQKSFSRHKKGYRTEFEERIVTFKRVSKTSKGGRQGRIWILVLIGNKKGSVGYGIGKAREFVVALRQAVKNAKKTIIKVKISSKGSVFHEFLGKHGASKVLIKPAKQGTGIIAGGTIKNVLELAGYSNVYSKNLGSNTSMNMVRACFEALEKQRSPAEVAIMRDKTFKELFHLN